MAASVGARAMAAAIHPSVALGNCRDRPRPHRAAGAAAAACMIVTHSRKSSSLLEKGAGDGRDEWRAVPDLWRSCSEKYGKRVALVDPRRDPPVRMTYLQVEEAILNFAEAMRSLGVSPDEHVALFADNSCRWLIADQGIMAMGAANAVRGSRSSDEELVYILKHSDSVALVIDTPELLKRLEARFNDSLSLKFVVLLWGQKPESFAFPVFTYEECISLGQKSREKPGTTSALPIQPQDVATIVYTSGTTGNPKGVMLTHANIIHQMKYLDQCIQPVPGDRFLSLLPPWHMYERVAEYFTFTRGIEQVYTTVKFLKDDLQAYPTQYFVSVPLVYDTLYSGVQKQLSKASGLRRALVMGFMAISSFFKDLKRISEGRSLTRAKEHPNRLECFLAGVMAMILSPLHFLGDKIVFSKIRAAIGIQKAGISGGGSLPKHVDKFFEVVGITLLNGYGLTESSPVVSTRAFSDNVLGTVGMPLPETEVKIVDPESRKPLANGNKGIVTVRGPQVMKGYYKNPDATQKAIDGDGWLDTGDLGWVAPVWKTGAARKCGGMLVLEGRAKETIVLSTGENVEPTEIEEAALQSSLIDQIMVVGQDQRRLGALIVASKDTAATSANDLKSLVREELQRCTSSCSFQIGPFVIVNEPFTMENGLLTPTMKLRRDAILTRYRNQIDYLFNKTL
ncbi:long-chain-fatty-acid--[acyl-carrier-protein] ligase AEE15, chloroplastic [Selaginella moellendorffii]|nr:long-chain-fatty-acid--[acyl-carrier-protein] ligase AEE15, chloroplastic [Selaginella moellendorffii]|eukprot:XP_002962119.2 long-chain-fatty-acid--[acyl-carrier-protein] ligase AEE15, chloroplastic [Selaginella moellendorffii]